MCLDADLVCVAVGSLALAAGSENNVHETLVVLETTLASAFRNY